MMLNEYENLPNHFYSFIFTVVVKSMKLCTYVKFMYLLWMRDDGAKQRDKPTD